MASRSTAVSTTHADVPRGAVAAGQGLLVGDNVDGKTQFLIENPIGRCLIDSPILPDLKKNPDGSLTLYIQKDSPGGDEESARRGPLADRRAA
jgi:hypothetical protein